MASPSSSEGQPSGTTGRWKAQAQRGQTSHSKHNSHLLQGGRNSVANQVEICYVFLRPMQAYIKERVEFFG